MVPRPEFTIYEMIDETDAMGFLTPNHFSAHDHLHRTTDP